MNFRSVLWIFLTQKPNTKVAYGHDRAGGDRSVCLTKPQRASGKDVVGVRGKAEADTEESLDPICGPGPPARQMRVHMSHSRCLQARSEIGSLGRGRRKSVFSSPGRNFIGSPIRAAFLCAPPGLLPALLAHRRGDTLTSPTIAASQSWAGSQSAGRRMEKIAGDMPWRRSSTISR